MSNNVEELKKKIEESQKQIEELQKQAQEYLDGWKRAKADLVNFQKQTEREKAEWADFLHANTIRSILPVLDSLESAVGHKVEGVEKIRDQMKEAMKQVGVCEIKCLGEPPNPEFYETVGCEKSENHAPGLIVKEAQKGYLLNGRVLRPAKVIVSE